MSKTNSVSDFLTDLASAIKTKKGSSTAINAQNFANEIIALQAGLSSSLTFSSTNNLSQYLTNIADAIRAKKGTSATINAQDFATEVLNLPTETVPTTLTKTLACTKSNTYAATTKSVAIDATKTTWVEDFTGSIVKITTANNSLATSIYVYPSAVAQSGPAQGQTLHGQAYLSSSGDTLYYYKPQGLFILDAMKYDQT